MRRAGNFRAHRRERRAAAGRERDVEVTADHPSFRGEKRDRARQIRRKPDAAGDQSGRRIERRRFADRLYQLRRLTGFCAAFGVEITAQRARGRFFADRPVIAADHQRADRGGQHHRVQTHRAGESIEEVAAFQLIPRSTTTRAECRAPAWRRARSTPPAWRRTR